MKKMFFALVAALPLIAGCWPFTKEQPKQEMTETMAPATSEEATTPSEEEMTEETQGETEEAHDEEEK
jgi:hypothetical protein